MNSQLDTALCEKYPKIFVNRHGNVETTAMCWGFECGDGWYDLIDTLCGEIQHHLDRNASKDTKQFVAVQIKEKFGTLRFYGDGGDDRIRSFIWFAESFSGKICEQCGSPGKIRRGGYIHTACDAHARPAESYSDEDEDIESTD